MPSKNLTLEGIGEVTITKRRTSKNIKIVIAPGKVSVSQPSWLPFSAGQAFLLARLSWVRSHMMPIKVRYTDGQKIGQNHTLHLAHSARRQAKITTNEIYIGLPTDEDPVSASVQQFIDSSAIKALRSEAEDYLPVRTRELAAKYGFTYKSVSVKLLKRRWGSCTAHKDITYNLRLMELMTTYIDYVILHELTHTEHMNHGDKFWARLVEVYPYARKVSKTVRRFQPQ